MHFEAIALANFALYGIKLAVVIPMAFLCITVMLAIPMAASRGKLHIPGYVGIAILAFGIGLLSGRLAGAQGIAGRKVATVLSVAFFVLLAAAVGSLLALFVYRHPSEP